MEIWIVNNFEPFSNDSDKTWRYGFLAKELNKCGIKTIRFKSDWDHFNKKRIICNENDRVVYKTYGYNRNRSLARIVHHKLEPRSLKLEFQKRKSPDLIITSIPTIEIACFIKGFCLINKIPYIIDIRDQWPDQYLQIVGSKLSFIIKPYYNYLLRKVGKVLRNAEAVSCISGSYQNWISQQFNIKNSHLFPIGIDCKKLPLNSLTNRRDLTNKVKLLFVGSLTKAFDFSVMFQFLKRNANFNLTICGSGPMLETLRDANMKNVVLKGWLNGKQLSSEFENADYGITPYSSKNTISLPNKPYEYLAKGLPIINSLGGDLSDLIQKNDVGYNYHNIGELDALKAKIMDQTKYLRLVKSIRKFISTGKYTVDKIYPNFADLIYNCALDYNKNLK
ncbi:glycosyltransferase [Verrucomicrobia bacterium]|nr:glycosyltransferase [Verrucomicrobiota bacterium]